MTNDRKIKREMQRLAENNKLYLSRIRGSVSRALDIPFTYAVLRCPAREPEYAEKFTSTCRRHHKLSDLFLNYLFTVYLRDSRSADRLVISTDSPRTALFSCYNRGDRLNAN